MGQRRPRPSSPRPKVKYDRERPRVRRPVRRDEDRLGRGGRPLYFPNGRVRMAFGWLLDGVYVPKPRQKNTNLGGFLVNVGECFFAYNQLLTSYPPVVKTSPEAGGEQRAAGHMSGMSVAWKCGRPLAAKEILGCYDPKEDPLKGCLLGCVFR